MLSQCRAGLWCASGQFMPCLALSLGSEAMVVRNSVMGGLMGRWVEWRTTGEGMREVGLLSQKTEDDRTLYIE